MSVPTLHSERIGGHVHLGKLDATPLSADAIRYSLDGFIQRRGTLGVWEALAGNQPGR